MIAVTQEPGCPVLKLKDHDMSASARDQDAVTMLRLWTLVNGGHAMRDHSVGSRFLV